MDKCVLSCKEKYLLKTYNSFNGEPVYICINCKRHYISNHTKGEDFIPEYIEVRFNYQFQKWEIVSNVDEKEVETNGKHVETLQSDS